MWHLAAWNRKNSNSWCCRLMSGLRWISRLWEFLKYCCSTVVQMMVMPNYREFVLSPPLSFSANFLCRNSNVLYPLMRWRSRSQGWYVVRTRPRGAGGETCSIHLLYPHQSTDLLNDLHPSPGPQWASLAGGLSYMIIIEYLTGDELNMS